MSEPRIAVFIPAYKRPEYTAACLLAIEEAQEYGDNVTFFLTDDGSLDGTAEIMERFKPKSILIVHRENLGLRNTIIEFFNEMKKSDYDYLVKIDNDCIVPKRWLKDLTEIFQESEADILSPNTSETNAAHKYGYIHKRQAGFIPSHIVGGLWYMKREMIEGIFFEPIGISGIKGAFNLITQIVAEKEPKIGWTDKVTYQDVGYLSGSHPCHIKSEAHASYSAEVGRPVSWNPEEATVE